MARSGLPITGEVLAWAIAESALTAGELAERLGVDLDDVLAWTSEDAQPSKGQVTKLAHALGRPTSFFFLPSPPESRSVPTEFRRSPGRTTPLTAKEVARIRWARSTQELVSWVRRRDAEEERVELRAYSLDDDPDEVGSYERAESGISLEDQRRWASSYTALRSWRELLEAQGITVMQLDLGSGALRGFSAWDEVAPMLAVNSALSAEVRSYTLMHEFGHLLTRTDMACASFAGPRSGNKAERWCERFAAAFLLPGEDFRRYVRATVASQGLISEVAVVTRLATRYKVSARAVAIRLSDLGLADRGLYSSVDTSLGQRDWTQSSSGGAGETGPEKRVRQLGVGPISLLLGAYNRGDLTRRDLQRHLRLDGRGVDEVESMVSG